MFYHYIFIIFINNNILTNNKIDYGKYNILLLIILIIIYYFISIILFNIIYYLIKYN